MADTRRSRSSSSNGWALVELLTVMVLSAFLSSVLVQTTACLKRCLARWEASARMRQSLSAALFQMAADFRTAGCNPKAGTVFDAASLPEMGEDAGDRVRVRMDTRGAESGSSPDGDIEDPGEDVLYQWDDKHQVLRRNSQPMAAGIVENPGGESVFKLEKEASLGLIRLFVTTRTVGGSLSLSNAICIRNAL